MIRIHFFNFVVFASFLLYGCHSATIPEPEVKLDDSVLVIVMTDSYILNSAFQQTTGIIKDSMANVYTQQVLNKWGVDKKVFDENVQWLYSQPERLDSIYEKILDRLDLLEDGISGDVENSANKK